MANCPQCQTPYEPGAAFCDNCGASLAALPPTPMAAPAPAAPPPTYAPTQYAPPPAGYQAQPAPLASASNCTQCNMPLAPGAAFCDNCGAPVAAAPTGYQPSMPTPPVQPVPPAYQPPIQQPAYQPPVQQPPQPAYQQPPVQYAPMPRFMVLASQAQLMPQQPGKSEYIIGREDPVSGVFPEFDLTPHGGDDGGVSRKHARLFFQNGQWMLEDLDSANYTYIATTKLQPRAPTPLQNGVEVRFGRVKLQFFAQ